MALTANQGLDLPDGTDNANVPLSMTNYNSGVENRLVQRYLSIADRTARNAAPFEGELSYLADLNRYETFTGAVWNPLLPAASYATDTPAVVSASVTYTTVGGAIVGGSVTVPPSGQVEVVWTSFVANSIASLSWLSVQVNTGSVIGAGVPLVVANDIWAIVQTTGTNGLRLTAFYLFTGLAPGTIINAFLMHRVSSGTGTFERRSIKVLQA